jgi:hypothetical protein
MLISADDLVRWTDLKNVRPIITWAPPASHELKWNIDGSSSIGGVLRYHKEWYNICFLCQLGLKNQIK